MFNPLKAKDLKNQVANRNNRPNDTWHKRRWQKAYKADTNETI